MCPRSHFYVISRLFPFEGGLIRSISRASSAEWGTPGAAGIKEEGGGTRAMIIIISSSRSIKLTLHLKSPPQSRRNRSPLSRRGSPTTATCSPPQPRTRRSSTRTPRPRRIISMPGITPRRRRRPRCPRRMITTTGMAVAADPTTRQILVVVVQEGEGGTLMLLRLPPMWSIRRR